TAYGYQTLYQSTFGGANTAIGLQALFNCNFCAGNTAIGFQAGSAIVRGNNNIDIGNVGSADDSDTIIIGTSQRHTFTAASRGTETGNANAVPVVIDSSGQLGTVGSSQ